MDVKKRVSSYTSDLLRPFTWVRTKTEVSPPALPSLDTLNLGFSRYGARDERTGTRFYRLDAGVKSPDTGSPPLLQVGVDGVCVPTPRLHLTPRGEVETYPHPPHPRGSRGVPQPVELRGTLRPTGEIRLRRTRGVPEDP